MHKYYTVCGSNRFIVLAHNPVQACIRAMRLIPGEATLGTMFYVDERGFRASSFGAAFCLETSVVIQIMMLAAS